MYEYDGTKHLTGLARSIDALFSEPRPTPPEPAPEPALEEDDAAVPEGPGIGAAVGAAGLGAVAASAAPEAEPEPVGAEAETAAPPPLPDEGVEAEPPPLPEAEASPPPLPEAEASPPPLPEAEASPPPLPDAEAAPPSLPESEPSPPPLPEPELIPSSEAAAPASDPLDEVATAAEDDGVPPTELDVAVEAYLAGDGDRSSEIERLGGELVEAGNIAAVARSVGRIAHAAGEPPDAAMLSLAQAISSPEVLGRLARQMGGERLAEKREEYFRACRNLGPAMARAIRDDLAENTDTLARSVHCEALTQMGSVGREVVEEMVADDVWFLARNGVAILGDLGGDGAVELVQGALANPDARVRREALRSLAKLGAENAGELVTALLEDTDEGVQMAAAAAAGELGVQRAVRPLVRMLDEAKDPDRAVSIIRALGQLGDPGAVPAIEKHAVPSLFSKPRTNVRVAAYRALYHIGTPHAMKLLAKASSDKDPEVQSAVLGLRKAVGREG